MTIDYRGCARAMFARSSRRCRLLWPALLFLAFLLVGLRSYRDYGISWDEPTNRKNGMISLGYVGEVFAPGLVGRYRDLPQYATPLSEYVDRAYGVAFEAPLALLERVRGLKSSLEIYQFRHLVTFVVCSLGAVAVFRMAERRFSDWRLGLLGALFLILSPRLFADSFYNSKDAVFMALFAIAMSTAVRFLLEPTSRSAVCHAAATALAIDVRVVGILLPVATALFFLLRMARARSSWRALSTLAVYLAVMTGLVVAFWPYLWPAPGPNFLQAVRNMSQFPWDETVLYLGEVTTAPELPWHYIPVWIGISTPILYLVLFAAGTTAILARLVRNRRLLWQDDTELQDLFILAMAVGPLLSVIVLDSVLYDGWRQMYFLYPAFVLVSLRGWVALRDWRPALLGSAWPGVVALGTVMLLAHTAWWMWRAHPYQNVYVNALAGRDAKSRFDLDYWGLTNREALQFIVDHDQRPSINVWPGSWTPLATSALMLPWSERSRVHVVADEADADYIVTNYRRDERDYASESAALELFHQITVDGEIVNATYRRLPGRGGSNGK